jgi:hypothetical protein
MLFCIEFGQTHVIFLLKLPMLSRVLAQAALAAAKPCQLLPHSVWPDLWILWSVILPSGFELCNFAPTIFK